MTKKSKLEVAQDIAASHFRVLEQDLQRVFLLAPVGEEDLREPIKLLEVVRGTLETGFEPIAFAANPGHGVPYPSVILEISPRQFGELENGEVPVNGHTWKIFRELHAA
jgi:hypothetical protein